MALGGAVLAVLIGWQVAQWTNRRDEARIKAAGGGHVAAGGRWLPEGALGGAKGGISSELLAQVRRIHISTKQQVSDLMAGEYSSVFKGRGMEFEEVREYVPGDDVRAIDWNVTARMEQPYVKEFREERELVVMILVDISASGDFGTTGKLKNELAAELAATLAFAATRNNDKVGLLLFTDRIERFIAPKKGRGHVWRVIREILDCERHGSGTDLAEALGFLNRVVRRKAVVFLISDFLDDEAEFEQPLRIANRKHDLVVFKIEDPRERSLPDVGFVAIEDAETGRPAWLDTSSKKVRTRYKSSTTARARDLQVRLRKMDVDLVELSTNEGVAAPLVRYFRSRERRA
ncbi:MAG: DUF58 domain-containing protein [Proteobacteria bacterium]|nr:DUF58 domain-containing protein [Pseudomonadota bacterium]